MKETQKIRHEHEEYILGRLTYYTEPLIIERASRQYVWDVHGKRYLDFFGGIVTISVGHVHPKVTSAIIEQINKLQHISTLYITEPHVNLARKMAEIAPPPLKKSFITNSGTEANETAILLARSYTGDHEIIALRHSYSGRTFMAMSLTGLQSWRVHSSAIAGIKHAVAPYCYRCSFGLTYPSCDLKCAFDIDELILTTTGGRIAGFIAEPILGIGGFIVPPKEYFKIAVDIIRKYGGIFICDEIQTGFGRTGTKMFGIEHFDVSPDVMTCAKGIANGHPVAVTIARPEVADSIKGLTISTFGGNPVACVAALATIEVIEEEKLPQNAQVVGDYFRSHLERLKEKYKIIGDVRGMGLMQAIDLVKDRKTKEPATQELSHLLELTRQRGLLIGRGGLFSNIVRLSPPLNIDKSDVDEAIRILDESLSLIKM